MALTKNAQRTYGDTKRNDLPVATNVVIYREAMLSRKSTGYVAPLTAGEKFAGFAETPVDNTGGSNGAKEVSVLERGVLKNATVVGVDGVDDERKAVYASDDNTLTLTATGNSFVGYVHRWKVGTTCDVEFMVNQPSAAIADATDAASAITQLNLVIAAIEKAGIAVPN